MAVMLKGGPTGKPDHDCLDEIGRGKYDGVHERIQLPVGSIARCSCGELWRARKYAYTGSKWEPANWYYRMIYSNRGWTDGNRY